MKPFPHSSKKRLLQKTTKNIPHMIDPHGFMCLARLTLPGIGDIIHLGLEGLMEVESPKNGGKQRLLGCPRKLGSMISK